MGERRWIIVNKRTRKPAGLRFSYPTRERAQDFAGEGEEPAPVEIVSRSGPFSDRCRRLDTEGEPAATEPPAVLDSLPDPTTNDPGDLEPTD